MEREVTPLGEASNIIILYKEFQIILHLVSEADSKK